MNAYIGSSIVILFSARNEQGVEQDISAYEKKVILSAGSFSNISADITPISNSSFQIHLSGETTKKLGSGLLNVIVELKNGEDERTGKATPLNLLNPNRSNGCVSDSVLVDNGCVQVAMDINNPTITLDLVMGSTIINGGGGLPLSNQTFIDLWNVACGQYGQFNKVTGFFELNGITDLDYQSALEIYTDTGYLKIGDFSLYVRLMDNIKTNLPLVMSYNGSVTYALLQTLRFDNIEVLNLCSRTSNQFGLITSLGANTFQCPKCIRVIGDIVINSTNANALNATNLFIMPLCEDLRINLASYNPNASATIAFAGLPLINLASLSYLVSTYTRTQTITIRVHANVYTKLTDPVNYPTWAALVTTAQSKNITFAI